MAIGLFAGLGGSALALVLPEPQRVVLAGAVLAAVGGAYLGFGVADGRASAIVVQAASFVRLRRSHSSASTLTPVSSSVRVG
jgi:hypothetical protein